MPTVLRARGYRFSFYSYDLGEAPHVHVTKGGCEAKLWLSPLRFAWNKKFTEKELADIFEIALQNINLITEKWNERSGN